jgi:hypothetical protein
MLTLPIAPRFALLVVFGFFVWLALPLYVHETSCPPQKPESGTIQGDGHASGKQGAPNQIPIFAEWISATEHQQASGQNEQPATHNYRFWSGEWFCGDLKITDLALVFFTYCLVVVGWYTMRSNERTLHDMERAHLFISLVAGSLQVTLDQKLNVHVVLMNLGRSIGFGTELYIEFSVLEPAGRKARYIKANGTTLSLDVGVQPNNEPGPGSAILVQSEIIVDQFMFGYIRYIDTFRKPHTNRFCMRIAPAGVSGQPAGSPAYGAWD